MNEETQKHMLSLAAEACKAARSAGADQAESWLQHERSITVSIENNELRSCESKDDPGYCIRAITNGAVGYARGMGIDSNQIGGSAKTASAQSRAAEPDPSFVSLPNPAEYKTAEGLYDPSIAALHPSDVVPWALECVEAARAAHPDVSLKADITVVTGTCAVANSLGVAAAETYTFTDIELFSVISTGGDVGSFFDFTRSRTLDAMKNPASLASETTKRAATFLGSSAAPTAQLPVVLGPLAAWMFIRSILEAADAESVQRGRSFLAGKLGKQIASASLTIVEDPLHPGGMASGPFDAEGTPRTKRELISGGVLNTWLHNSTTAGRSGEKPTGHAERHGYLSGVATGVSNTTINPGGSTEADIISSISDGIYILMGSLAPNPVSGAVSGTIDFGYRISNGKIAGPVSNGMIGGAAFDILSRIAAVSSDFRDEPGNIMPSILIDGISVSGG